MNYKVMHREKTKITRKSRQIVGYDIAFDKNEKVYRI